MVLQEIDSFLFFGNLLISDLRVLFLFGQTPKLGFGEARVRACVRASLSTASFFVVFLVVCWRRFGEEVLKFLHKELECSAVKYREVIWLASKQAIPTRVFSVLQCFVSQVLLEQLFLRKDIHSLSLSLSLSRCFVC